jgi:hypothetical protein
MRTNQAIYFILLTLAALVWVKFGPYPILIVVAVLILLSLWSRVAHRRTWTGDGYIVRVKRGFREEAWVHYEEAGRTLSLRSIWANQKEPELSVEIDELVYFPPDYGTALPEERIQEIQARIAEGLQHMRIRYSFFRMRQSNAN